jgi:hypothetical protein
MKPQQKNYNILLILILIFFPQISKCGDCTDCTTTDDLVCRNPSGTQCDSNCKTRYDTNQCYDCGSSSAGYYTIISQDSDYICQLGCQGNKIIGDTGECTDQPITTHVYQLGNVYFFSGDPSTDNKLKRVYGNLYECKSYHIKENINGKEFYTCHDLASIISQLPSSATYYFDSTKGELLQTGCPNGLNKKKKLIPLILEIQALLLLDVQTLVSLKNFIKKFIMVAQMKNLASVLVMVQLPAIIYILMLIMESKNA